jgi:enoyl-CoA hydratase
MADIVFERRGPAGVITLNRPRALNALNLPMIRALREALDECSSDDAVTRVVITSSDERAFCAGGDLREIYKLGRAGHIDDALTFFREEYQLNAGIKHFAKPYVALLDGITMGGGVGISAHGSHRVAGDRLAFAMPEVGIGFFPDVGGTFVLPRLAGEIGTYCALTADRLGPGDAVAAGLATHYVPSPRHGELLSALCSPVAVDAVLADFAASIAAGPIAERQGVIDRHFAGSEVEAILEGLDREQDTGWEDKAAASIRSKAPLSLKIALAQIRRGAKWSFAECMRAEFRVVSRVLKGHDFYEGVRAVIIDKDNAPQWRPARLAEVDADEVDRHFAAIEQELDVP